MAEVVTVLRVCGVASRRGALISLISLHSLDFHWFLFIAFASIPSLAPAFPRSLPARACTPLPHLLPTASPCPSSTSPPRRPRAPPTTVVRKEPRMNKNSHGPPLQSAPRSRPHHSEKNKPLTSRSLNQHKPHRKTPRPSTHPVFYTFQQKKDCYWTG